MIPLMSAHGCPPRNSIHWQQRNGQARCHTVPLHMLGTFWKLRNSTFIVWIWNWHLETMLHSSFRVATFQSRYVWVQFMVPLPLNLRCTKNKASSCRSDWYFLQNLRKFLWYVSADYAAWPWMMSKDLEVESHNLSPGISLEERENHH